MKIFRMKIVRMKIVRMKIVVMKIVGAVMRLGSTRPAMLIFSFRGCSCR